MKRLEADRQWRARVALVFAALVSCGGEPPGQPTAVEESRSQRTADGDPLPLPSVAEARAAMQHSAAAMVQLAGVSPSAYEITAFDMRNCLASDPLRVTCQAEIEVRLGEETSQYSGPIKLQRTNDGGYQLTEYPGPGLGAVE